MRNLTLTQRLNGSFAIVNVATIVMSLVAHASFVVPVIFAICIQVFGYYVSRSVVSSVERSATQLGASLVTLTETSENIERTSGIAAEQATSVSATSSQVSGSVTTVAAAVDEMHASIAEIARAAGDATQVAGNAVNTVHATNQTVAQLGASSAEIGKVIEVITSIAEQTNLLALNATIEAARAGEAGKGFAVVANEVKELAKETSEATEEISRRIAAIQTDTNGAVAAIEEISAIISQINDIQSTIASAVEEQTATTTEIARSITEAALGTGNMSHSIETFALTAQDAATSASANRTVVDALREVMQELQTLAGRASKSAPVATYESPAVESHEPLPRRDMLDAPSPKDVVDWADPDDLANHGAPAATGKYRIN